MRYLILLTSFLIACGDDSSAGGAKDAAIDSAIDPCLLCAAGQICVQSFDGTCRNFSTQCVTKTVDCAPASNACTQACQDAYCASPTQCMIRGTCGGESTHAFTCYGP